MLVWSVSATAWRSASTGHHTPGIHPRLDDLESDLAADRFLRQRHVNSAAPAFSELLPQLVAPNDVLGCSVNWGTMKLDRAGRRNATRRGLAASPLNALEIKGDHHRIGAGQAGGQLSCSRLCFCCVATPAPRKLVRRRSAYLQVQYPVKWLLMWNSASWLQQFVTQSGGPACQRKLKL